MRGRHDALAAMGDRVHGAVSACTPSEATPTIGSSATGLDGEPREQCAHAEPAPDRQRPGREVADARTYAEACAACSQ